MRKLKHWLLGFEASIGRGQKRGRWGGGRMYRRARLLGAWQGIGPRNAVIEIHVAMAASRLRVA